MDTCGATDEEIQRHRDASRQASAASGVTRFAVTPDDMNRARRLAASHDVCPNGHPFPLAVAVPCDQCAAQVTCEPIAHGMELDRAMKVAEAEIEHLRSTLRAVHDITRPGYPAANAGEIVAEAHRFSMPNAS